MGNRSSASAIDSAYEPHRRKAVGFFAFGPRPTVGHSRCRPVRAALAARLARSTPRNLGGQYAKYFIDLVPIVRQRLARGVYNVAGPHGTGMTRQGLLITGKQDSTGPRNAGRADGRFPVEI